MRKQMRDGTHVAVPVAVLAIDPAVRESVVGGLAACSSVRVLRGSGGAGARVLLVIAAEATDDLLALVEQAITTTAVGSRVVLVIERIAERQVLRAVRLGLAGVLNRREAGLDRIVRAVHAADSGRAQLPEAVQRLLLDRLQSIETSVLAPIGFDGSVLSGREVEVLRLLSEGMETAEVAVKMNYSVRTIKNVVHDVTRRLGLRNRTHAVAYALRSGAL